MHLATSLSSALAPSVAQLQEVALFEEVRQATISYRVVGMAVSDRCIGISKVIPAGKGTHASDATTSGKKLGQSSFILTGGILKGLLEGVQRSTPRLILVGNLKTGTLKTEVVLRKRDASPQLTQQGCPCKDT